MDNYQSKGLPKAAQKILQARHHAPFEYLGKHTVHSNEQYKSVIRAILPEAVAASIIKPLLPMRRLADSAIFEVEITDETIPEHYSIEWQDSHGNHHHFCDPYSFTAQISDKDLKLFIAGKLSNAEQVLGAHITTVDEITGVLFSTWAPNAECVSVIGDFNRWDRRCHAMQSRGASGIWELFIPGLTAGEQYQFEIRNHLSGEVLPKPDPFARQFDITPNGNAIITASDEYLWQDQQWMHKRAIVNWQHAPISCYQVHLRSWKHNATGDVLNYRELATQLVDYVRNIGFTHIELLTEQPAEQSGGYFAPDNSHGTAEDFHYFIDYFHQHRIGIILNWTIDHLPPHCDYLRQFDGAPLYERAQNGSVFDYSSHGVRNFLIASAHFWLSTYHIDGLRLSTNTSMLYHKDQQNSDAVSLIREITERVYKNSSGVLMIADENTVWPNVTSSTELGGLGFSMKWNNGWHHDTIKYLSHETGQRPAHHEALIFNQHYAFNEKFMLPFSHPNEQQESNAQLYQIPGNEPQRFANLRLLYTYLYTHPGKKLLFMGNEFSSTSVWNGLQPLPWALTDKPLHRGLTKTITELNSLYRNTPALHYYDFNEKGFEWIDCHDASQSLLVFRRNSDDYTVIVALNFSASTKNGYRIGVPYDTHYREIFNSDAHNFGGEDRLNTHNLSAEKLPWMKQPFSITITLPSLSAVILKPL